MNFNIGDYVTRKSYNNDTIFIIEDIKNDIVILKGVDIRLYADSTIEDLVKCEYVNRDSDFIRDLELNDVMDRGEYFYLPAKILQIDAGI